MYRYAQSSPFAEERKNNIILNDFLKCPNLAIQAAKVEYPSFSISLFTLPYLCTIMYANFVSEIKVSALKVPCFVYHVRTLSGVAILCRCALVRTSMKVRRTNLNGMHFVFSFCFCSLPKRALPLFLQVMWAMMMNELVR